MSGTIRIPSASNQSWRFQVVQTHCCVGQERVQDIFMVSVVFYWAVPKTIYESFPLLVVTFATTQTSGKFRHTHG
jgi:hypothetical protein